VESFFKGAFTPDLVKEYVMTSPLFAPIIEQAHAEGEAKRRQQIEQIALNLLADGMSPEYVAKITGMDIHEVKKLAGEV
jgi:predicted transposase YdaD